MRTRCVEEPFARDTFLAYRRPTGSNPFHPSRGPLAAILPLFPRRLQFPILFGLNLMLMPGEHVLRRDVSEWRCSDGRCCNALRNPPPDAAHLRATTACQGGCTPLWVICANARFCRSIEGNTV